MLETIPADEVDLDGKALAVRYRTDRGRSELVVVTVTAHRTEGDATFVRKSELTLVAVEARMTRAAMQARVRAEAARRGIQRVAWIEET
jgi:hypothetical protein